MNERIRELKIQACKWASKNVSSTEYENAADQKFAELIVRECGRYLDSPEFIGRSDLDWSMVLNEHFGVE
jgi:hypothetical protein